MVKPCHQSVPRTAFHAPHRRSLTSLLARYIHIIIELYPTFKTLCRSIYAVYMQGKAYRFGVPLACSVNLNTEHSTFVATLLLGSARVRWVR